MQCINSSSSDEDFRPSRRPVPGHRVPLGVFGGNLPPAGRGLPPAGRGLPPAGCGLPPAGRGLPPAGRGLPPAGRGLPPAGRGLPPAGCGLPPRDGCRRGGPCGLTRCALCDSMRPSSYWCPERMNSDESSCGSSCPACEGNPGSPDYYRYPTSSSSASLDMIVISSDSSDILES